MIVFRVWIITIAEMLVLNKFEPVDEMVRPAPTVFKLV